ncbi:hypothetical protein TWF225_009593 [Orbilia oligospora]|nr:hypothetical protein TWF225_009593 [Orbilia oligospora]KAF3249842.1 hypothetical protein TWF217_008749 [Orbilia oligospora]KAF3259344.1 hypothetical protein TWF128_004411 [Orbilia oligospora]
MSSPRASLIRTLSISSATSQQTSSEWGGSQATLTPGATRQNKSPSGSIHVRFITPENALEPKLSGLPIFQDQIPLRTTISALKDLVKRKVFQRALSSPYVVDIHLQAHPILTDDVTLYDLDLVGTQRAPLNLFVVLRYNGTIGIPTKHFSDFRSTSNNNAWHPVEGVTRAGVSTFCASLEMLKRKVTDGLTQRRFLTAVWQTTHFLPAVYAMASLFDSRTLLPEEKAALVQTFQALCVKSVPDWATGGKVENALEGSRQLLGWLLDQVIAGKRGGSGKEEWTKKAIIKQVAERKEGDPVTTDNNIANISLLSGDTVKVTVEFLDKNPHAQPDQRQLVLSFRDKYPFDGNSYLVVPKDAGNVLEHRILHRPTQDGFYEQIINTTNLPALCTVAPLSLSSSKPPVLTLNNEGLISIFEFGGECATEWANIWNPITGVQQIMSNDQGQGLAKTLKDVIQARKVSGAWPLDGWDVGCLNASTVDTRRPKEAVMICVDCSSSMFDPAFTDEDQELKATEKITRMTAAKMLFKHYSSTATNYKLPVHFGVMKFNATVSTMQEFTPLLDDIEKEIEKLHPAGMTAMWDCIYEGAEQLLDFKEDNPDTKLRIIVLTDGIDNRSKQTDKTTYSYLWENNIVLDAFCIGTDYHKSLFRICGATGGYAMKPASTAEIIQLAEMETMLDQTLRPLFPRQTYLPYFDTLQPLEPFTVTAFSVPEARDHPHQNDEFMSLANAHKAFGKNKQLVVDKAGVRAASDVVKNRRLLLEIKDMAEQPHPDMDIYVSESEMAFWKVVMQGPDGSNYASGTFVMFLDMTDDFPRKAPQARFITPIIHPNINKHGRVCHAILDQDWKAETKVRDIVCCIYGLLMAPERNEPVDAIATLKYWTQDENLYSEEISQHIKKFASANRKDWASRIVPDLDAIPGAAPTKTTTVTPVRRVTVSETIEASSSTAGSRRNAYDPTSLRKARFPIKAISPPASSAVDPEATVKTTATVESTKVTAQPVVASSNSTSGARPPVPAPIRLGSPTYKEMEGTATVAVPASPTLSATSSNLTTESVSNSTAAAVPRVNRFASVKSLSSGASTASTPSQRSVSTPMPRSSFFGALQNTQTALGTTTVNPAPTTPVAAPSAAVPISAPDVNRNSFIIHSVQPESSYRLASRPSPSPPPARPPSINSTVSNRSSLSFKLKKVFKKSSD